MFTFSEMLALVESESSFGAYVCHRRPGGSLATSDLVDPLGPVCLGAPQAGLIGVFVCLCVNVVTMRG